MRALWRGGLLRGKIFFSSFIKIDRKVPTTPNCAYYSMDYVVFILLVMITAGENTMQFFHREPPVSRGKGRPGPFLLNQFISLGGINYGLHQSTETHPARHVLGR